MISAGIQASKAAGELSSNEALLKAAGEALARDIQNGEITKATIGKLEAVGVDVSTFKAAAGRLNEITASKGGFKAGINRFAERAPVSASIKGDTFATKAAFDLISKNPGLAPYALAGIVDELFSNS